MKDKRQKGNTPTATRPGTSGGVAKHAGVKKGQKTSSRQVSQASAFPREGPSVGGPPSIPAKKGKKMSVLDRMRQRLTGGRFRWLNEQMYTTKGDEAERLMQQHPEYFEEYHEGFREQTKGWPQLPVDVAIQWLAGQPLGWTVADLGCGEAKLATSVQQKVVSYDLVAQSPGVIPANMADLPQPSESVDVSVMCLALMGTDYSRFLAEAVRILKPGGILWIAEVKSRFVDADSKSGLLDGFISAIKRLNMALKERDEHNTHFIMLQFEKKKKKQSEEDGGQVRTAAWPALGACQYKKR